MIFTPGMQKARERRDRGHGMEERKRRGEKVQGRGWQEMTADTGVWKRGVIAERATEKANQQLVTPYITLKGGLLGIDFGDHGSPTVDV